MSSLTTARGSLPALHKPTASPLSTALPARSPPVLSSSTALSTTAAAAVPTAAANSGGKAHVCGNCGGVYAKATAKFCSKCGAKKVAAAPAGKPQSPPPPRPAPATEEGLEAKSPPLPPHPRPDSGRGTGNVGAAPPRGAPLRTRKESTHDSSGAQSLDSTLDGADTSMPRRSSAMGTAVFHESAVRGSNTAPVLPTTTKKGAVAHTTKPPQAGGKDTLPLLSVGGAEGGKEGKSPPHEDVRPTTPHHHCDVSLLSEARDEGEGALAALPASRTKAPQQLRLPATGRPPLSRQERPEEDESGSPVLTSATMFASATGSFKTIEASAEEEAQYTAWSTLGPEGLTPEMLQTQNAKDELRLWRKGAMIGRGTYGSVYLGLLPDGSFYAVKCVELGGKQVADMAFSVKELVSLSREINMMQRLRHRNLCTFKGVLYEADTTSICMFMEYVGGGSLSSIVKRFKPLPDSVIRRWTRQLLSGLLYLHSQNIVHRDVKGDNVLIDTGAKPESEAQVKLVDFGAARRLTDAMSQSRTVIGTPYWMAPEVVDIKGEGKGYSYKADVWSVGCTVAEMLTGRPPWPAKPTAPAAILMVASAEGIPTEVPKEEASPGCYAFMLKCFERDPEKRPTVEELLQDPWIRGELA